ncbi:MAG: glycoside hydrolase family 2 protein [Bacteroidales bacterium]|nr:glycoside hydrolase family 2 protein [Bacteroidales bacterium]
MRSRSFPFTRIGAIVLAAFVLPMLMLSCGKSSFGGREVLDFDNSWSFSLTGEETDASAPSFDDASWRVLNLPHDWSIEGDFEEDSPTGTGGGALRGGIGWYRKTFTVPSAWKDRKVSIEFDGVYMNSTVFVNGEEVGNRPNGFVSFSYDITPHLRFGKKNTVAVKVDNSLQPNLRWYSGSGIYRNVRLVVTNPSRIAYSGTFVSAQLLSSSEAKVTISTEVEGDGAGLIAKTSILDASGLVLASGEASVSEGKAEAVVSIRSPHRWSIGDPYLYTARTELISGGKVIDECDTPFGVRTIRFDDKEGFFLNGEHVMINGVCLHHDLGCLGSAVNTRALERQLEILRGMGCNAIRTSHNPPAPELLDLCDRMGFLVQDEAFDVWRKKKTTYDYSRFFGEWYRKDLEDFVKRDRNHPSVIMWSIGNEVLEQWTDAAADTLSLAEANLLLNFGHQANTEDGGTHVNAVLTKTLADIVRGLDTTRPVTAGCNETGTYNHLFQSGALDVIGFNYHNVDIPSVGDNFPGKPFIVSESVSALMTRGYYRMPSDQMFVWPSRWDIPFYDPSLSCSSYDNCHVPWGNTHEEELKVIRDNPFVSGQFIWTGFDYIGEPTPYGWPARSSYFGIVDLAGFPKDVYYLYKSEWTDETFIHLFPHWNWEEGQDVDMWCYYGGADEVELFVNGVSQGRSSKTADRLHAEWRVKFVPGKVEAAAYKDGKEIGRQRINTAGNPSQIRLTPDRAKLNADGKDLSFVTVEILDKEGNLCPWADNLVEFEVTGPAFIAGVDNGSPISMERFKDNKRHAFYGKCLVVLQNSGSAGDISLKATSEGLETMEIQLRTVK